MVVMTEGVISVEPDHSQFPVDAIFIMDQNEVLRRVMSPDNKKVLWPTLKKGSIVTPELAQQIAEVRDEGATISEVAKQFEVAESTVKRHLKSVRESRTRSNTVLLPDLSALENTVLPYSVRNAIALAIGTASTMSILSDQPIIQAHYQGYSAGFHAALAIICGAAGIDLSFLEVEGDNTSNSTSRNN